MAKGIGSILSNTRTRTMVLIVLGILIFGVVIAVSQVETKQKGGPETAAPSKTTKVPNEVKSTPGSDVTRKYAELQQQANARGAEEAAKKGTTFIPTLTGNVQGYSDADFEKQLNLAMGDAGGKCSKDEVDGLKKKGMDTTAIILKLKSEGCTAAQIAALFSPDEIAAALLAEKSCTVSGCGVDAVNAMKKQGLDETKIVATLKTNGCKTDDIVSALKASGSTPESIAAALKENGYSAEDIATAMKDNGYTADQIASALNKAGFDKNAIIAALTKAGFSPIEIAKAIADMNSAPQGTTPNAALLAEQQAAAQRLAAQQEAQQLAAYSQQRQGKIQELMTAMDNERKDAVEAWNQVPSQVFTQGEYNRMKLQAATAAKTAAAKSQATIGVGSDPTKTGKIILKAGSILFAVLDTAVDSDEPGPVLATIVSGSLKGSKLMGTMSSNMDAETISITFSAINMPDEANSMGISAVAIDPDTARSALASGVDHHYLYRYGSLLASSFVQGYAQAVASSGTTSTTSQGAAGVTTTTSSPAQNSKQQLWSGIAQVGQKWAQAVGQNYNRPITITIDQGTGLGVLVTADMTYGTNPIYYTPPSLTGSATTQAAANPAASSTTTTTTNPATNIPGVISGTGTGASGQLSAEQRQALWNVLQNSPVTTTPGGSTTVTTTSTMGGGETPP